MSDRLYMLVGACVAAATAAACVSVAPAVVAPPHSPFDAAAAFVDAVRGGRFDDANRLFDYESHVWVTWPLLDFMSFQEADLTGRSQRLEVTPLLEAHLAQHRPETLEVDVREQLERLMRADCRLVPEAVKHVSAPVGRQWPAGARGAWLASLETVTAFKLDCVRPQVVVAGVDGIGVEDSIFGVVVVKKRGAPPMVADVALEEGGAVYDVLLKELSWRQP